MSVCVTPESEYWCWEKPGWREREPRARRWLVQWVWFWFNGATWKNASALTHLWVWGAVDDDGWPTYRRRHG